MNTETEEDLDLELVETEEVILNRWGRLKQWWDMGSTVVKVIQIGITGFKLLFIGSTAAVIVGEATDTSLIRDSAVTVGIVQERGTQEVSGGDAMMDELLNLQEDMSTLEEELQGFLNHTHKPLSVPHSHDLAEHTHPPPDMSHEHPAVVPVLIEHEHDTEHSHDLPEHSHSGGQVVSGQAEIDDALIRHIADDH